MILYPRFNVNIISSTSKPLYKPENRHYNEKRKYFRVDFDTLRHYIIKEEFRELTSTIFDIIIKKKIPFINIVILMVLVVDVFNCILVM